MKAAEYMDRRRGKMTLANYHRLSHGNNGGLKRRKKRTPGQPRNAEVRTTQQPELPEPPEDPREQNRRLLWEKIAREDREWIDNENLERSRQIVLKQKARMKIEARRLNAIQRNDWVESEIRKSRVAFEREIGSTVDILLPDNNSQWNCIENSIRTCRFVLFPIDD